MPSPAFIARQPIFNPKLEVVGYELLFRGQGYAAGALIEDAQRATATVVLNALTELDMHRIVANKTAWINVSREFLLDGLIMAVPPSVVGLDIPESETFDKEMIEALRELKDAGYQLALDDFRGREGSEAVLELFDVVKLSMPDLGRQGLARADQPSALVPGQGAGRQGGHPARSRGLHRRRLRPVPGLLLLPARPGRHPRDRGQPAGAPPGGRRAQRSRDPVLGHRAAGQTRRRARASACFATSTRPTTACGARSARSGRRSPCSAWTTSGDGRR